VERPRRDLGRRGPCPVLCPGRRPSPRCRPPGEHVAPPGTAAVSGSRARIRDSAYATRGVSEHSARAGEAAHRADDPVLLLSR
jgi:hypothetical protein